MGKQTNAQVLRFLKKENWLSKYYSDFYNYSNFIIQDDMIRSYIINILARFNTKIAQVYIHRRKHRIIVELFSYNDSFLNWNSFLSKYSRKRSLKNKWLKHLSRKQKGNLNFKNNKLHSFFEKNPGLELIYFSEDSKLVEYANLINYFKKSCRAKGYSVKSLIALNLSYLLKTNVVIRNTNIISKDQYHLLLKVFRPIGFRLRSPLSKYLRVKFVCLVYHALLHKSSLLLCRYLRFIIPRFCKKKRKSRRINPFFKSVRSVFTLMFLYGWVKKAGIKGIKVVFKGRINGSRRKRVHVIKKGRTSTQSFNNIISYHQEDCLTIFGVLGIKVWIIY